MTHSEIRSRTGIQEIESMLPHCHLRWLGHVIRMPHSILPHCVPYGQLRLDHRSVGGQKKRLKNHIKSILKKCNIPFSRLETLTSNRTTWRSTCAFGMSYFDTMNTNELQLSDADISMLQCSDKFRILSTNAHFVADNASHTLASSATAKPTFNVEEEVVVIFQIGAGLYAVGRPVQQKRTAKSAPITPCHSRKGPYSTVFSVSRPMDPLMWLAGLLALSGDVETNPGPSTQTWTCDMCSTEHSINKNKTQQQINSKKTITIIQININGLSTKIHELKNLTDNTKIDIITIQETKLKPTHRTPYLKDFTAIRADRTYKNGEGLMTYKKNDIIFTELKTPHTTNHKLTELQHIKIHLANHKHLNIFNIYIPP